LDAFHWLNLKIRELSLVFQPAANMDSILTFTPASGCVGDYRVTALVHVVKDAAACGYVEVGDAVVRVNGGSVSGLSFPDVITKIRKASAKLMIIHFYQILPAPRLSIRDSSGHRLSL
jgi:hypothetical protein